jgi:hypothetical protein
MWRQVTEDIVAIIALIPSTTTPTKDWSRVEELKRWTTERLSEATMTQEIVEALAVRCALTTTLELGTQGVIIFAVQDF